MVVFALMGNRINTSDTARTTNQPKSNNNEFDILDELMGLNKRNYTGDSAVNSKIDDLDTSSFNLDDIMKRISAKNSETSIDYRYALLSSLYSQVDFLKQQLLHKDNIIDHLIATTPRNSNYDNKLEINDDLESDISISTNANNVNSPQNSTASSIFSGISTDSSTFTNIVKENYDRQIANYRYKNHWEFIENKRKANDIPQLTNSQKKLQNEQRIKDALDKIKNKLSIKEPNVVHKTSNNDNIPGNEHANNDITIIPSAELDTLNAYTANPEHHTLWKKGTTLIIGDSMLHGLDETRLRNSKVRVCPGASIEDLHYHIIPLLRKRPSTVILHVGTNNSTRDTSAQITDKLINFKEFIMSKSPGIKVIISSLIQRYDDAKAQLTSCKTNTMLKSLDVEFIDNDNITREHLGKKGHHMTPYGTGRLAINIIKVLKSL